MPETPSPCVDICKYRRMGRCSGCAMTEMEKRAFDVMNDVDKRAFLDTLIARQQEMGINPAFWATAYRHKCRRAGVESPLDITTTA
ncbi:MAG: DUF1289 domain-containing protein [Pseudomonadota bacterium]